MDIDFVRSRFIKHFDGTTGAIYTSPGRNRDVSTSLANILIITADSYSPVQ